MHEYPRSAPRIAGLSRGDAYSPPDSSGIPLHLFDALARRYPLVGLLDTRLPRWQRALVAGATFAPSRSVPSFAVLSPSRPTTHAPRSSPAPASP